MKESNIENFLAPLEAIAQVEAPPFLWTRIEQQIANNQQNIIPMRKIWVIAAAACIIFTINSLALVYHIKSTNSPSNLANGMNLVTNNNLYNE